jgi:hypothetical protein
MQAMQLKQQRDGDTKLNNTHQAQGSQSNLFDNYGDNRVKLEGNESENENDQFNSTSARARKQTRF